MTWERRWHPLREEWVTITSHRNNRPWSGSPAQTAAIPTETHDPDCYLCPGNTRVSGALNPEYQSLFVFDNDHPAYSTPAVDVEPPGDDFFKVEPASGICRVVCFSPDHHGSLAQLSVARTHQLIDVWAEQTEELVARQDVHSVMIFENKGEVVGVSNNHPHGQIYAPGFVIDGLRREASVMEQAGSPLMQRLLAAEQADGRRMVVTGEQASAFVPYFARFPYETYIVPHERYGFLFEMNQQARASLAAVLNEVLVRYDNLWCQPFPYMLVLHQSPCDGRYRQYHTHIQIHPPMRQPGLQKYLAAVETGGGHFLNDGSPEDKAAELRAVSAIHYTNTAA